MDKKILIVNDTRDAGHSYTPFFYDIGPIENNIDAFILNPNVYELVVFTGGSDVSPSLYGDTSPKGLCFNNETRDAQERKVFEIAKKNGIGMYGICRGIQFLNVMAGGKLMHDIQGHGGGMHKVQTCDGETFETNSLHHQMCIPPVDGHVLAWSIKKLSRVYIGNRDEKMKYVGPEVEGLYLPSIHAAGVQYHPEAMKFRGEEKAAYWAYHLARDICRCSEKGMANIYLNRRPRVSYVNL